MTLHVSVWNFFRIRAYLRVIWYLSTLNQHLLLRRANIRGWNPNYRIWPNSLQYFFQNIVFYFVFIDKILKLVHILFYFKFVQLFYILKLFSAIFYFFSYLIFRQLKKQFPNRNKSLKLIWIAVIFFYFLQIKKAKIIYHKSQILNFLPVIL